MVNIMSEPFDYGVVKGQVIINKYTLSNLTKGKSHSVRIFFPSDTVESEIKSNLISERENGKRKKQSEPFVFFVKMGGLLITKLDWRDVKTVSRNGKISPDSLDVASVKSEMRREKLLNTTQIVNELARVLDQNRVVVVPMGGKGTIVDDESQNKLKEAVDQIDAMLSMLNEGFDLDEFSDNEVSLYEMVRDAMQGLKDTLGGE